MDIMTRVPVVREIAKVEERREGEREMGGE